MRHLQYLAFFFAAAVVASAADSPEHLKDVKAIYVAPLEGQNTEVADMLRAKLISTLTKIQGISVVEDEDNADAILTGSGLLQSATNEYGHTHYVIQGGMRLISKEGGVVLWADNITSSRFARSASSSFAENVAKSLGRIFADRQKK
jgi:TolB-like protein